MKYKVLQQETVTLIGNWCGALYYDVLDSPDENFIDILDKLSTMELGHEFAFTYEELAQIADDLIAGKDVKL